MRLAQLDAKVNSVLKSNSLSSQVTLLSFVSIGILNGISVPVNCSFDSEHVTAHVAIAVHCLGRLSLTIKKAAATHLLHLNFKYKML